MKKLKQFKKDFISWCGFELEAEDRQGILDEIKSRQWQMECDLDKQAKSLQKALNQFMPEED